MPDLLDDLDQRGLVHDTTDRAALAARLAEGPITLYYGCDPTAPSLHHGNLIGLIMLRRFQDAGHRPIALAGGRHRDGRRPRRALRGAEPPRRRDAGRQRGRHQGPDRPDPGARRARGQLVDNLTWTADVRLLDFLRDVGKHVTVNQMVARESVKARMESEHGISYTEFSYMLLQANDYGHLHQHEGCELQIGGSDQWGNILSGVDLIRRRHGATVHALCWPLLTAADGTKIGKTTGARVWLDPELTSPYAFFQHWINTDDAEVRRMLAQFTLLPMDEVEALVGGARRRAGPARGPSGCWRGRSPRSCTAPRRRPRPSRPPTCCSAPIRGRPRRPPWPRSPRRCPATTLAGTSPWPTASTWCRCSCAPGWPRPRATRGASSSRGASP